MKSHLTYLIAVWLWLMATAGHAAMEQADKMAPEPTVGLGWVIAFLLGFVGICVGIGIAIIRASRKEDSGKNT